VATRGDNDDLVGRDSDRAGIHVAVRLSASHTIFDHRSCGRNATRRKDIRPWRPQFRIVLYPSCRSVTTAGYDRRSAEVLCFKLLVFRTSSSHLCHHGHQHNANSYS
jgi:hypothetical protein